VVIFDSGSERSWIADELANQATGSSSITIARKEMRRALDRLLGALANKAAEAHKRGEDWRPLHPRRVLRMLTVTLSSETPDGTIA
jgi:hypothetical protein